MLRALDGPPSKGKPWHSTPRWVWERIQQEKGQQPGQQPQGQQQQPLSSRSSGGNSAKRKRMEEQQHEQCEEEKVAVAVSVDIIKGRMMFLHTNALRLVTFAFDVNDIRGDDIAISGMVGGGMTGQHRVLRMLGRRILELPAPHALCSTEGAGHYTRREAVRQRFFPHPSSTKVVEETVVEEESSTCKKNRDLKRSKS